MKAINNLRAKLIHSQYGSGNSSIVVTDVLKAFMKTCPSCNEIGECDRKGCKSKKYEHSIPVLSIDSNIFNNDLANLVPAIMNSFPDVSKCKKCRTPYTKFERKAGPHLFVEVRKCYKLNTQCKTN